MFVCRVGKISQESVDGFYWNSGKIIRKCTSTDPKWLQLHSLSASDSRFMKGSRRCAFLQGAPGFYVQMGACLLIKWCRRYSEETDPERYKLWLAEKMRSFSNLSSSAQIRLFPPRHSVLTSPCRVIRWWIPPTPTCKGSVAAMRDNWTSYTYKSMIFLPVLHYKLC